MWRSANCCGQVIGVFPEVDGDVGKSGKGKGRRERRKAGSRLAQREIKPDIWKWTAICVHPVVSKHRKRTVGLKPLWGLNPPQNDNSWLNSFVLCIRRLSLRVEVFSLLTCCHLCFLFELCAFMSHSLFQHILHCCHLPFPSALSYTC